MLMTIVFIRIVIIFVCMWKNECKRTDRRKVVINFLFTFGDSDLLFFLRKTSLKRQMQMICDHFLSNSAATLYTG